MAEKQKCRNSVTKLKFRGLPFSQRPTLPGVDQLGERPTEEEGEKGDDGEFFSRILSPDAQRSRKI